MAESEAEQRAVAKAEIMAAARHLTVAQLRWIAESFATGKSFLNCPKGRIAESLSYDFEGNRHRIGRSRARKAGRDLREPALDTWKEDWGDAAAEGRLTLGRERDRQA